jgi:hypothetical protein
MKIEKDKYYIIRSENAGVFFAQIEKYDSITREIDLINSRRLWYWDGAASLSQLSQEGTKLPNKCKFPAIEKEKKVMQVIEIIACSNQAIKSINEVPVWEV